MFQQVLSPNTQHEFAKIGLTCEGRFKGLAWLGLDGFVDLCLAKSDGQLNLIISLPSIAD